MKRLLAVGITSLLAIGIVGAEAPPPSHVAAPEIYKVIDENDRFRVVEATWKPGQKDVWHSHPLAAAQYHVDDCAMRLHNPDGTTRDTNPKAGTARIAEPVVSHIAENVGTSDCTIVFVEAK